MKRYAIYMAKQAHSQPTHLQSHCSHAELKENNNNNSIAHKKMIQNEMKWMLHDVLMNIEQQPFDTRKWFTEHLSITSHEQLENNNNKKKWAKWANVVYVMEKNFIFKIYPTSNIILTWTWDAQQTTKENITNPKHLLRSWLTILQQTKLCTMTNFCSTLQNELKALCVHCTLHIHSSLIASFWCLHQYTNYTQWALNGTTW